MQLRHPTCSRRRIRNVKGQWTTGDLRDPQVGAPLGLLQIASASSESAARNLQVHDKWLALEESRAAYRHMASCAACVKSDAKKDAKGDATHYAVSGGLRLPPKRRSSKEDECVDLLATLGAPLVQGQREEKGRPSACVKKRKDNPQ